MYDLSHDWVIGSRILVAIQVYYLSYYDHAVAQSAINEVFYT